MKHGILMIILCWVIFLGMPCNAQPLLRAIPIDVNIQSGYPMFWYGGSVIFEDGHYTMWVTLNDGIWRLTSADGVTWNNLKLVLWATDPWEDDGQGIDLFDGFQHGVSNACVLKLPHGYVMGYTAGPASNTVTAGGIGLAYSADGISWIKDPRNPIYATPGGSTYALSMLTIDGIRYFYFSSDGGGGPLGLMLPGNYRVSIDDLGRQSSGAQHLDLYGPSYPIASDGPACWSILMSNWGPAGPEVAILYRGGDCTSTLGNVVGVVDESVTGSRTAMLPFLVNRGPDGNFLDTTPFLLYSSGEAWATWHLEGIRFVEQLRIRRHLTVRGLGRPE